MPDQGQGGRDFVDLIKHLLADLDAKNRAALAKYLDFEKSLVEEHQRFVYAELSKDNETLKNFARMMMAASAQALAFQREHRAQVRDIYAALSDGHLKFIDLLKSHLTQDPPPKPGATRRQKRGADDV